MKKLGTIADRVLARLVPKQDAAAKSCWWDKCPSDPNFDAWCCDNNGGVVECACTG